LRARQSEGERAREREKERKPKRLSVCVRERKRESAREREHARKRAREGEREEREREKEIKRKEEREQERGRERERERSTCRERDSRVLGEPIDQQQVAHRACPCNFLPPSATVHPSAPLSLPFHLPLSPSSPVPGNRCTRRPPDTPLGQRGGEREGEEDPFHSCGDGVGCRFSQVCPMQHPTS